MKLLFDHNISPELIVLLGDLFPGSNHVYPLNLYEQPDTIVWAYARMHDFIVVSKDADFAEISMVHGFPPKLLWLRLGNCTTSEIEEVIRTSYEFIVEMVEDPGRSILSLYRHDRSS